MTLLYPFMFFLFIPLFALYKYENLSQSKHKKREKVLLYLSVAFAILALGRPVVLNSLEKQKFDAADFIIAIDASFSMQATDLEPSRYDVAKNALAQIINALPKNRFSIFAFTSNAILISPPTTDGAISLMALDSLEPKYIMTKGTSISELLKTVSKMTYETKSLIIFSDGGEENDLGALVKLAKKNNIIPFVVAMGTSGGSTLTLNGQNLKDEKNNLVISRVNPILKDFATLSHGKYYELDSTNADVVNSVVGDINAMSDKKQKAQMSVRSYKELFYFPIILSVMVFLMAVTKIHQLYVFLPLLFLPNAGHSSLLDFYHLQNANAAFKEQNYALSAKEFERLTPSVQSYYNKAVAHYQVGQYTKAVKIFGEIQTTDASLKQKILYNMGNCAVKLTKYSRAKIYYQKALNLGYDEDAFHNLTLLYSLGLQEKVEVSNMMPKEEVRKNTQASKKNDVKKTQKEEAKQEAKSSSGESNQKAGESSDGSSNAKSKSKQEKKATQKSDKTVDSKHTMGYKAYELINKGYTNEKRPW